MRKEFLKKQCNMNWITLKIPYYYLKNYETHNNEREEHVFVNKIKFWIKQNRQEVTISKSQIASKKYE